MVAFFFVLIFVYSIITVLIAALFPSARRGLISLNERAVLYQHDHPELYWAAFFGLLGLFWLAQSFLEPIQELIESDESDVIPLRGA